MLIMGNPSPSLPMLVWWSMSCFWAVRVSDSSKLLMILGVMKTKRLVALLMALVMIVGLFAMTASAVSGITCYACKNLGGTGTEKVMVDMKNSDPPRQVEMELPNNIVSIMSRMSEILLNCRAEDGKWASESEESEFFALAQRFEDQASLVKQRWDEMDNSELLTDTADSLSQQFMALEDADPAAAITEYMFARYCYDAALKVGNSVLSQSLMDYMNL